MNKQLNLTLYFIILLSGTGFSQKLEFEGVTEIKALKRGKEYSIKWSGGTKDQQVEINLNNAAGVAQTWSDLQNNGEAVITLSKKLKPGKGYSFKILVAGEEVSSQPVQVKRRIPLAVTISASVIVPAMIILIFSSHKSGHEIPDPDYPGAPSPPPGG